MTNTSILPARQVRLPLLLAVGLLAALLTGLAGGHDAAHGESAPGAQHHAVQARAATASQMAFHDQMRKLWEDHITWTRSAIVAFADGSNGFPAAADRLLRNQDDIGDAVKPFYGAAAGDQLTKLLREHITGAVTLLQAAKSGDSEAFARAKDAWYVNGDQVADLISSLDPDVWPQDALRSMMKTHLDQTLAEAASELGGDYASSVHSYDEIHVHILAMSDALSGGIMKQFPAKFRR